MAGKHKKQKRRSSPFLLLLLLLCLGTAVFTGYRLAAYFREYYAGRSQYGTLGSMVSLREDYTPEELETLEEAMQLSAPESSNEDGKRSGWRLTSTYIPNMDINYEALAVINEDIVAWIYCPDTVLDYPVLRAESYEQYIERMPNGAYNPSGSLFLDYHTTQDFMGRIEVIYGHNMQLGHMFGSLEDYKVKRYFDEHPYMYLYTKDWNYRIELIYGSVIEMNFLTDCMADVENRAEEIIEEIAEKHLVMSEVELADDDRVVVLSTCSYEFSGARFVLLGRLQPEFAWEEIPLD